MKEILNKTTVIERNGFVVLLDDSGTVIEIFDSREDYNNWFNSL